MSDTESLEQGKSAARPEPADTELPGDQIVIVPMRKLVLFPGVVHAVTVGRPASIAAAQKAALYVERIELGLSGSMDAPFVKGSNLDPFRGNDQLLF